MVRVFLIRVGMDSEYGGFVSPIFPDKSYVFVPIPNLRTWGYHLDTSSKGLRCYTELKTNSDRLLTDFLPKDKLTVCGKPVDDVQNVMVHNDPEFVTMTYGEKKQKRVIYSKVKDFSSGDYIVFYATFFPCDSDFRYSNLTLSELQIKQKKKKQYYIFAFLELKYPPIYRSNYRNYEDEIRNNAHYLRGDFERHDESFVLKGTEESGWIKPIRMDDGNPIRSNYKMRKEIAQYKLKNKDKRGLNRCYCELEERIIPLVLENKLYGGINIECKSRIVTKS